MAQGLLKNLTRITFYRSVPPRNSLEFTAGPLDADELDQKERMQQHQRMQQQQHSPIFSSFPTSKQAGSVRLLSVNVLPSNIHSIKRPGPLQSVRSATAGGQRPVPDSQVVLQPGPRQMRAVLLERLLWECQQLWEPRGLSTDMRRSVGWKRSQ
jgi:hypothetical protein